jgi:hypothetical protein
MQKAQKGFGAVGIIIILVVLALIAGIGYVVYQNLNKAPSDTAQNQPVPIDEPTYTLTLPADWEKADRTPNSPNDYVSELMLAVESTGSAHYYKDTANNYFVVMVDPTGRGFEANETWELATITTAFTIKSKTPCSGEFCTPTELDEYRVGMKTTAKLGAHNYFFFAGNTATKTGVDTAVYQSILESFASK